MSDAPIVLLIRDGWGHNPDPSFDGGNALLQARTPVADDLHAQWPTTLIATSGQNVGLPGDTMGNSEVGHQNIGAGRIVPQDLARLDAAIADGSFAANEVFASALTSEGNLHLVGLVSDGCVHSSLAHLLALIDLIAASDLDTSRLYVHVITDGRDCRPDSGLGFVKAVESHLAAAGCGRIATVMGRYYAMDRDHRWERTAIAFEAMTGIGGAHPLRDTMPQVSESPSATEAVQGYYDAPSDANRRGDEFIVPARIEGGARIADGDTVLFFNFRGDRPRQITRAFVLDDAAWDAVPRGPFERGACMNALRWITMTGYEDGLPVTAVAFDRPEPMKGILGSVIEEAGLTQFRCAETEKFPHVTFFFNDYREGPFAGEQRTLIPSPVDVTTYDQAPRMSADAVTDAVVARLESDDCEAFLVVNLANCDMVGHTGNLEAAIAAAEAVDECCSRIIDATLARGGSLIVTADHGNAERMIDPVTGGPDTAHTTFNVPLHVVGEAWRGGTLREGGRLADIAPTLLAMRGITVPVTMTGTSLIA